MEEYITKGMKTADLGNPELVIDAIKDGFRAAEMGVRKGTVDHTHSGSTCIVVVVIGDVCLCGNVGDSRAVLIRETGSVWIPVPLSRDQKPTVEEERARIIERGGKIAQYCSSSGVYSGPLRVWLPNQPLPGLAMTRSIGDSIASRIGVIGEPEVHQVLLTPDDQGLLLASDGLWEIMQNEEAVELVRKHVDHRPEFVVEKLMEEAQARWLSSNADDTTIMYVRLAARRPSI
jgi:serine/threonine protein phosphatase PrpC